MNRRLALPAVALLAFALTSCAGTPADPVTVTVTETVTAEPEPEPEQDETAAEEVEAPTTFAVGQTQTMDDGWTVTVYAVDTDPAPNAPAPESAGTKWTAADVETCNSDSTGASVSSSPWNIVDTANRQFEPSSVGYQQFPEPSYGWGDVPIAPGECIRGWIVFTVAQDAQLTTVKYQPSGLEPMLWAIG